MERWEPDPDEPYHDSNDDRHAAHEQRLLAMFTTGQQATEYATRHVKLIEELTRRNENIAAVGDYPEGYDESLNYFTHEYRRTENASVGGDAGYKFKVYWNGVTTVTVQMRVVGRTVLPVVPLTPHWDGVYRPMI